MSPFRRLIPVLLLLLTGFLTCARAEEDFAQLEISQRISAGQWLEVDLTDAGGLREYTFTAPGEAHYALCAFPLEEGARVRVEATVDGALAASGDGEMALASLSLAEGSQARLRLTGRGRVAFEVSRQTLSRCCEMPIELSDGGSYSKQIARPGDDHWYALNAEAGGAALLSCVSEEGIALHLMLLDSRGRLLAYGETLSTGAAALSAEFQAGSRYLLRVSAAGEGVGKYRLNVLRSENTLAAEAVTCEESLVLTGRSVEALTVELQPEDACTLAFVDSSDWQVVATEDRRRVMGREPGQAEVVLYVYGGARATCQVTVERVAVQRIRFPWDQVDLAVGDQLAVSASLEPANATLRGIRYASSDEKVVQVDKHGLLTALGEGSAEILAIAEDRGLVTRLTVRVQAAVGRCRALLIGQQQYGGSVDALREGSVRSVEGVMSLLQTASFSGSRVSVTTVMDAPRDAVVQALRKVFAEAGENDVSILYITCHGFYAAGMTQFLMADGSVLSAVDLSRELSAIPGKVVLLCDCCASGGVIGRASRPEELTQGVMQAFGGPAGPATLSGSKYRVLASACLDQDSYRLGSLEADGDGMATAFGRALCEGAGWNLSAGAADAMRADEDGDGQLTMAETEAWLRRRVNELLGDGGDYVQSVCAYPEQDGFVWFARTQEGFE